MRDHVPAVTGFALAALLLAGGRAPLGAQGAGTLPLLDPVYHDLQRLEDLGLAPRGVSGLGPYSGTRVRWVVERARARWAAAAMTPAARADLDALLTGLEGRFAGGSPPAVAVRVEAEAGGGRSPGESFPDNGLGGLAAVSNPLWSHRGGRAYEDRVNGAVAARVTLAPAGWLAVGVAGRSAAGESTGVRPGRRDGTVEALYARVTVGDVALQVGRDGAWVARPEGQVLVLGDNGPPLDMIRLGTERPLRTGPFGDLDFSLFVADLGAGESFPHAKLFGALFSTRPVEEMELGLTLLNKQMGEGAPEASPGDRIKDLTWVWDVFRASDYRFSDKRLSFSVRGLLPGFQAYGEMALNDFDTERLRHTFRSSAGYRLGLYLPALGEAGRHWVRVEASTLGPFLYRHHQYVTGAAVDGYLQGSPLGSDARSATLRYGYDAPRPGWRLEVAGALEERGFDVWAYAPATDTRVERVVDRPQEIRRRASVTVARSWKGGGRGVSFRVGVERVVDWGGEAGAVRTNQAALLHGWWGF